jgi:hypothetical protein
MFKVILNNILKTSRLAANNQNKTQLHSPFYPFLRSDKKLRTYNVLNNSKFCL